MGNKKKGKSGGSSGNKGGGGGGGHHNKGDADKDVAAVGDAFNNLPVPGEEAPTGGSQFLSSLLPNIHELPMDPRIVLSPLRSLLDAFMPLAEELRTTCKAIGIVDEKCRLIETANAGPGNVAKAFEDHPGAMERLLLNFNWRLDQFLADAQRSRAKYIARHGLSLMRSWAAVQLLLNRLEVGAIRPGDLDDCDEEASTDKNTVSDEEARNTTHGILSFLRMIQLALKMCDSLNELRELEQGIQHGRDVVFPLNTLDWNVKVPRMMDRLTTVCNQHAMEPGL